MIDADLIGRILADAAAPLHLRLTYIATPDEHGCRLEIHSSPAATPKHQPRARHHLTEEMLRTRSSALLTSTFAQVSVSSAHHPNLGVLYALPTKAYPVLQQRDLAVLVAIAHILADELTPGVPEATRNTEADRVQATIAGQLYVTHWQPIFNVETLEPVIYEALTRFTSEPPRLPEQWFAAAALAGLGVELELAVARAALAQRDRFPAGTHLAINFSPSALISPKTHALLRPYNDGNVIVELTEHEPSDYERLRPALDRLRHRNIQFMVDDVGAGHASLRHILTLHPDAIKLDASLITALDQDPARQALVHSMIDYALATKTELIAEGVETREQFDTLKSLGITRAQGWFLAEPKPAPGTTPRTAGAAAALLAYDSPQPD